MKKPTLRSEAAIKTLGIILAASLGMSACEAPKANKGKTTEGGSETTSTTTEKTDKSATGTTPATSGATPDNKGAQPAAGASATGGTADNTTAQAPQGPSELDDLPQLSAVRTVSLSKMKDSLVICTVDGTPITVDAFKKEFRQALLQLQAMITSQPEKVNELLIRGRQMGVSLTDDEHKRLLETARHKEALEGKTLAVFLKEKKITEQQFNEQVLMLGLAFKTGTKLIETQLLSEMINRELLLKAARDAGFARLAMNRYIEFKHGDRYAQLVKGSSDTPEAIKDQIVNHEMMVLMMDQIAKQSGVTDEELKSQYEKNREGFKHGERLHLSHIVIAAPMVDNGPLESIRTQIKKQKPGITKDELDKEEKVLEMQQHNNASDILARALKGEDFKTLADRYSDDVQARNAKTGGDLGWLDLSLKVKNSDGGKADLEKLTDAVKNVKVGGVAPDLVRTNFGWHIVKLNGKQDAGYLSFEEAKPTLKNLLGQQSRDQAEVAWMKNKRKKANIKLSDEFVQAAAREKATASEKPVTAQ